MQIPGFDTQHSINQDQWSIPVIQTPRKQREYSQCYLWLDGEFRSSLGYITGFLLKRKTIFEEEMEKLKKTICFPLGLPHRISSFGEWHSLPLGSQTETLYFLPVSSVTSHPLSQEILSHLQTDSNYVHRSHFSLPVDPHTKTKTSDSCNCFLSAFLVVSLVLEDPFSNNGKNV